VATKLILEKPKQAHTSADHKVRNPRIFQSACSPPSCFLSSPTPSSSVARNSKRECRSGLRRKKMCATQSLSLSLSLSHSSLFLSKTFATEEQCPLMRLGERCRAGPYSYRSGSLP
jgi:hypothetical protein